MSVAITCPDCRAKLKANKTPRSNKLMQCLKCGCHFTLSDSLAATSATAIAATKVRSLPKSRANLRRPHVLVGIAAVLMLVVAGFSGVYFAAQPVDTPATPKDPAVAAIQVSLPAANLEADLEAKDDIQHGSPPSTLHAADDRRRNRVQSSEARRGRRGLCRRVATLSRGCRRAAQAGRCSRCRRGAREVSSANLSK